METLKKIAVAATGVAVGYVAGVFIIRGIDYMLGK